MKQENKVELVTESLSVLPPTKQEMLDTNEDYRKKAVVEITRKLNDAIGLCDYDMAGNYLSWLKVYNPAIDTVEAIVADTLDSVDNTLMDTEAFVPLEADKEETVVIHS